MSILRINNVSVKAPSALKVTLQDIDSDDTNRTLNGNIVRDRVVGGADAKRKVECSWKALTNKETSVLLQAMGDVAFNVTYPDPFTGTERTMKAYVGDRSLPIYIKRSDDSYIWESMSANFVEY